MSSQIEPMLCPACGNLNRRFFTFPWRGITRQDSTRGTLFCARH